MSDWMTGYLDTVRAQLHWKQAQPVVLRELEAHLEDQCEAYRRSGLTRDEARQETIRQMGDPVAVGQALDQVHRPRNAWEIVSVMAALLAISLGLWVFVFYEKSHWTLNHWLWTPLWSIVLGGGLCFLASRLDLNRLAKRVWLLYGMCLAVMALSMLYTRIWLDGGYGPYYLGQYAGLLLPFSYGCAVYALRNKGQRGLALCAAALVPPAALCWFSGNVWLLLCLCVSAAVLLLVANGHGSFGTRKGANVAVILGSVFALPTICLLLSRNRLVRTFEILQRGPEEIYLWNYIRGLLTHSQPLGAGDEFLLPNASSPISPDQNQFGLSDLLSTDYLLAGTAYLCGWVVALALLLAVVILLVLLLRRCLKQRTLWGALIACAVTVPLIVQTAGYALVNLGLPIGGFRLPLLSYGGKFRVLDLALLGLLLATARCRTILRDEPGEKQPVHTMAEL